MSGAPGHHHDHAAKGGADHSHDHGIGQAPEKALRRALVLTGGFMLAEAIGGYFTNSLALISDAAHMLTDTAALAIALIAIRIGRRAPDNLRTFGYARFEILAAMFNAVVLFLVAMYILYEAIERFRNPPAIASGAMMGIAALGLIVNMLSMRLLRGGRDSSLNVKGAYLEVWSDMLGSVGVLAAGAIIALTGWKPIDPIIAVLIGLWVLPRTWTLLKDSLNVLLEGVPGGIAVADIEAAVRAVPGVKNLHHLHVWAVSSGKSLLTAHVDRDPTGGSDTALLSAINAVLRERFQISHSTLQLEDTGCTDPSCDLVSESTHTSGSEVHAHSH
ncbi:MAG TPA: cation diffusion facilitator family transporter [Rhodanobacteraceae bacterium]|nr:cation diffusion facilitator family transporter [Rhodanobacteraceae bacterium]